MNIGNKINQEENEQNDISKDKRCLKSY